MIVVWCFGAARMVSCVRRFLWTSMGLRFGFCGSWMLSPEHAKVLFFSLGVQMERSINLTINGYMLLSFHLISSLICCVIIRTTWVILQPINIMRTPFNLWHLIHIFAWWHLLQGHHCVSGNYNQTVIGLSYLPWQELTLLYQLSPTSLEVLTHYKRCCSQRTFFECRQNTSGSIPWVAWSVRYLSLPWPVFIWLIMVQNQILDFYGAVHQIRVP